MGVGRRLRDAREARGVTLTALAEATKIQVRQLQMLEAETYHRLPGGIFVRGYVRAVAKALGLDADRVVDEFRREQQPDAESPAAQQEPTRAVALAAQPDDTPRLRLAVDDEPAAEGRGGGRVLAVVLVAISVIVAMLWLGRDAASGDGSPVLSTAGAETTGSGDAPSGREPRPALQPQVGTAGAVDPASLPARRADARATPAAESESLPSTDVAEASGPGAPLEVVVEAQDRCWVTVQADGRRLAFRMFEAGETMRATGRRHVMVRAGNPAALRLTVNGTSAGMGSGGREREVHLTPANYKRVLGQQR